MNAVAFSRNEAFSLHLSSFSRVSLTISDMFLFRMAFPNFLECYTFHSCAHLDFVGLRLLSIRRCDSLSLFSLAPFLPWTLKLTAVVMLLEICNFPRLGKEDYADV
jgi:hypothetical protein